MLRKCVLITGVTGLVGRHLLKLFLQRTSHKIFIVIRADSYDHAILRVSELIENILPDQRIGTNIWNRLWVVIGDVNEPNLGLSKEIYEELGDLINEIFHSAALAEFRQPLEKVRRVNVEGTRKILEFAQRCPNLSKFHYLSSAFIAGRFEGCFSENDFNFGQKFNNTYEQSKFEAEQLIRNFGNGSFIIQIYRPSIIVGDYHLGLTNNFRMFYQPFRSLSLGYFNEIPIHKETLLNIIPCDAVAEAIFCLSQSRNKKARTYHIVSPQNLPIMHLMNFASSYFGYKAPKYVDLLEFNLGDLTTVQRKILEPYIPYFNFRAIFSGVETFEELISVGYSFPKIDDFFLTRLFKYCCDVGYIQQMANK